MNKLILIIAVFSACIAGCKETSQTQQTEPQQEISKQQLMEQQEILDQHTRSYEIEL